MIYKIGIKGLNKGNFGMPKTVLSLHICKSGSITFNRFDFATTRMYSSIVKVNEKDNPEKLAT
jgi:hypothetical protein